MTELDSASYMLGKNRINQDSVISRAASTYGDTLRKQRAANSMKTMDFNYGRAADNAAYGAAASGFGKKGGTYQRTWQNYNQNRDTAYRDFNLGQQADDYGYQLDQARIGRSQTRGLEDVELSEFERKANLAASLRGGAGSNVTAGGAGTSTGNVPSWAGGLDDPGAGWSQYAGGPPPGAPGSFSNPIILS